MEQKAREAGFNKHGLVLLVAEPSAKLTQAGLMSCHACIFVTGSSASGQELS